MASKPFATNPNSAAEVSNVQLRGGFDEPASLNPLDIARNVIDQATPFAVQHHQQKVLGEVGDQLASVTQALEVAQGFADGTPFAEDAIQDPVVAGAKAEFEEIKRAVDQGLLPRQYAVARYEEITANAISDAPQFQTEIKAFAKDTLGFSPQQKFLTQLMEKTPQEQAYEQTQIAAAKVGLSVDQYVAAAQNKFLADQTVALLDAQKKVGSYNSGSLAKEASVRFSRSASGIMEIALAQITEQGGITDPDILVSSLEASVANEKSQLLLNLPADIPVSEKNAHLATLDNQLSSFKAMIESGDMEAILNTKNGILKELAINDIQSLPGIGQIYAIDPQLVPEALGMLEMQKQNPEGWRQLLGQSKEGREALGMADLFRILTDGAVDLGSGTIPTSESGQKGLAVVAGLSLQNPDVNSHTHIKAINALEQTTGAEVTYNTLGDSKIVNTVANDKTLHGAVVQVYQAEVAQLQREYNLLVEQGYIPIDGFKFEGGMISVSEADLRTNVRPQVNTPMSGTVQSYEIQSQTQGFAERFNRLVDTTNKYSGVGVIPDSLYSGSESLLAFMQQSNQDNPTATPVTENEPTVEVWDFDADGNLVPVQ